MSRITLGTSPITNTIYAGRPNKAGTLWVGEKHDVTDAAITAVMQYIHQKAIASGNEYEECSIRNFNGYKLTISAKKIKETENE